MERWRENVGLICGVVGVVLVVTGWLNSNAYHVEWNRRIECVYCAYDVVQPADVHWLGVLMGAQLIGLGCLLAMGAARRES